jgi:hypothetical protein
MAIRSHDRCVLEPGVSQTRAREDGQRLRRRMERRVEERGRQTIATKEPRLTVRPTPEMPLAGRSDPPARKDTSVVLAYFPSTENASSTLPGMKPIVL